MTALTLGGGWWAGDRGIEDMMSSFRVMVVEDDDALRAALARALRLEGYAVDEATDGARALAQLASLRADVMVLDVMLPEVDGLTVCQRLRAMGDRTPVLLLTARDLVADRVQGLKAGADDYLTKPFAVDELLARVQALIRRSYPDHDAVLIVADLSLNPRTRVVQRGCRDYRAHADRVRAARGAHVELRHRDEPRGPAGASLGLRRLVGVQHARRLCGVPAAQDRRGW